jgi:hypothetical protein
VFANYGAYDAFFQLLYARLLICKDAGAKHAAEKYVNLYANPVAVELGLDESNGPSALLAQLTAPMGDRSGDGRTNVLYAYLLDACEKVFDSEMDQGTFEEHMRWFFGTVVRIMVLGSSILCGPNTKVLYRTGLPHVHTRQDRHCPY